MQAHSSRWSRIFQFGCAASLLTAACLLAACDRHSAQELPESYGHGSSHDKSYDDHRVDSLDGKRHFSDTRGTDVNPEEPRTDAPSPAPTAAGSPPARYFPSGT